MTGRRPVVLSALLGMVIAGAIALFGDVMASQVPTPEPGTTASIQTGYVWPMPGGTPGAADTLEMTRLQIGAGEQLAYLHAGAAIYYVETGSVVATFANGASAVRLFELANGDPNGPTQLPDCTAGCTLDAGDWFSFDADLDLVLSASADATVLIASLTPHDEPVVLITEMSQGTPIVIVGDSGVANP